MLVSVQENVIIPEGPLAGRLGTTVRVGGCTRNCGECVLGRCKSRNNGTSCYDGDCGVPSLVDLIMAHGSPECLWIGWAAPQTAEGELFNLLMAAVEQLKPKGLASVSLTVCALNNYAWLFTKPFRLFTDICIDVPLISCSMDEVVKANFDELRTTDTVRFLCKTRDQYEEAITFIRWLEANLACGAEIRFRTPSLLSSVTMGMVQTALEQLEGASCRLVARWEHKLTRPKPATR